MQYQTFLVYLTLILFILHPYISAQSCLTNYQYSDPSTGICKSCPTQCLSCFDTSSCTACIQQFYVNNNACQQCPFGCAVCTDANTCTTCVDGLYINSQGVCVACALGVKSCTIAIVQSCLTGYFMLGDICVGCFQNCATCQDFVTCTLCVTGYYVGSTLTSCQKCSVNCAVCQDINTCTSCIQGFTLNGGVCVSPSCASISMFCTKCANGQCLQCAYGKYLDSSNNKCIQGASILCLSSTGSYNTNCQTSLYGCPSYAVVQIDLLSGNQLPVCLPLHATQNSQYIYKSYKATSCSANSSSSCSLPSNQTFTFATQKSYYKLTYHISIQLYSFPTQQLLVSIIDSQTSNSLAFFLNNINITEQFSQNIIDPLCYNCKYGTTIITGQLSISGGINDTILQISSNNGLFHISQIILQLDICKVSNCALCTTAIDCIACSLPYYLQMISCVQQCDPGFYQYGYTCVLTCPISTYPISSSYQCVLCIQPCLTCTSASQCISCIDGYFLDGNQCLTTCSKPQLFTNLTSKICQPCPNPCTYCTVVYNNISGSSNTTWNVVCSGCGVGYLLQNGQCTYICPLGTFQNYINNKTQCTGCITGCTQCIMSQTICLACSTTYLLFDSQCHINYTCSQGYYINTVINSCQKCHYPCLTCTIIPTNCTSCIKGSLYNNTCPILCPFSMYINITNSIQICASCISPCLQCISSIVCTSCINGKYLYNGNCYADCPVLTYFKQVSNNTCVACLPPCLECLSSILCLSCTTGYIDLSTHSCKLQCNSTSYPDTNFTCQLCPSPCISCYSPLSCLICQLPYILYNESCITVQQCYNKNMYIHNILNLTDPSLSIQSASCLACTYPCASCNNSAVMCLSCVSGYLFVGQLSICVSTCPQSYYQSSTTSCLKCNTNCLTCQLSPTNCTSCATSMYLYSINSTCLQTCPSGYYGSNQQQLCKQCISPCGDCYNAYLCKSCSIGIVYNKACVSVCPSGSIHNISSNTCDPCTNNCLSCSIIPSNCTQCSTNGYYFYNNTCITVCPILYYGDNNSHNCQLCIQPCKTCISSTQCLSCITNYYLIKQNNHCSITCPIGYYTDIPTLQCILCNITICRSCSLSANNCTQCANNYYYDFNIQKCVQQCPIGTYADNSYQQCRLCQFPCIVCNTSLCLQCMVSYQLYNGNCYSQCPIGYYANVNNSCDKCLDVCQICTAENVCVKCVDGYFVNISKICVALCQKGYYGGVDVLTSYQQCILCPVDCIECVQAYNCTICKNNYYLFNGICMLQCPSLYYAYSYNLTSPTPITIYSCQACPQFCNTCTSSTICTQCLNSYIYKNLCYSSCPTKTYTFNQQYCIDCIAPCLSCTSPYSCITCLQGYFYFQNYCMKQCPDDVWKYPDTMYCQIDCPYNKYIVDNVKQCYINGCGGMLVQNNGYCLQQCPNGYYVDNQQNCQLCTNNIKQCNNLFEGNLQILRSFNLKICIYFNQFIKYQEIDVSKINITFYYKSIDKIANVNMKPLGYVVQKDRIIVQFGYNQIQLYSVTVILPYLQSAQMEQSLYYNVFKANIYVYNNYQYQSYQYTSQSQSYRVTPSFLSASQNSDTTSSATSTNTSYNQIYSPSKILNALAIVIIAGCAIFLIINIVCKGAHYRQLLDFLQFIAATIYLQIQYPPILQSYLRNLKLSLFSFIPQLQMPRPYSFSPSKFIQYNNDSSLMRSQGILFIIYITLLITFFIIIIINKCKPHLLNVAVARIKYRNITDLFSIVCLPLLMFSFRFNHTAISDLITSIIVIFTIIGFIIFMSYFLMTVKNLQQIAGLAGQLQATQSALGHMYTPFSFLRKIIFSFVICIQPNKPISNLTLLLIFTIMIMVCLFFYQPFENQITDYVTISMEIALVIFIIIVMIFGLNLVQENSAHYMGIVGAAITVIAGIVGLCWLGYLTYTGILKYKKQRESLAQVNNNAGTLQQNLNSQQNNEIKNYASSVFPHSEMNKENDQIKQQNSLNNNKQNHEKANQDEPSASQLIRNYEGNIKLKKNKKLSKFSQQLQIDQDISQVGQQFRHWNNSDSQKMSDASQKNKAPKYLLKMEKNKIDQQYKL